MRTTRTGNGVRAEQVPDLLLQTADRHSEERTHALDQLRQWRDTLPRSAHNPNSSVGNDCTMCNTQNGSEEPVKAFSLWLELEERCNLDCLFCYNPWRSDTSGDGDSLSVGEWKRVLDTLFSELTIDSVTMSGGEPLMYSGLIEVVEHVRARGVAVAITTNGRSCTRSRVAALVAAGVEHLTVPVHSDRPEIHDRLTGRSSWHSAVRALALASEAGMSVAMSTVLTSANTHRENLVGLCRVAAALGVRSLVANYFHPVGQGADNAEDLAFEPGRFDDAVRFLDETLDDVTVTVGSPAPGAASVDDRPVRVRRVAVSPRGSLKFCNHSSTGFLDLSVAGPHIAEVLRDVSAGRNATLLESVDNCLCLGRT